MGRLTPDFWFEKITDITPEFLRLRGISWAAVDMDNTLTFPNTPTCPPEILQWLKRMQEHHITLVLVSNNKRARVLPVARAAGLPYIWRACKPFSFGIRRASRLVGAARSVGALIGDQLFTDIRAARSAGVTAILVDPLTEDTEGFVRFKRGLERKHRTANASVKEHTRTLLEELRKNGTERIGRTGESGKEK